MAVDVVTRSPPSPDQSHSSGTTDASTVKEVIKMARVSLSGGKSEIPAIPRVDHWFKRQVQEVLTALVDEINGQQKNEVRETLQVALSTIIVQVSNQESDTRYAAVEKNATGEDVFLRFERAASYLCQSALEITDDLFQQMGHVTVMNKDVLTVRPDELPFFGLEGHGPELLRYVTPDLKLLFNTTDESRSA